MEKSLASATVKVSNHIYDDVAFVILSKLPVKSLFRFCCVRKSWSLLFENPYFMDMFRRNFLSKDDSYCNDTSLLLHHTRLRQVDHENQAVLYSLFGERFENRIKLDWPNVYGEQIDFNIHGFGSVNGILCIENARSVGGFDCVQEIGRVVLWNPTTDEYKITPPSPFLFESPCWYPDIILHGFGYDQVRDDYKVIRFVMFFASETWEYGYSLWEIYCLKSNSWRKVNIDMPIPYASGVGIQVYTDGMCHWWSESETRNEFYLVSFELANEVFVKTLIPSNMDNNDIDSRIVFKHLNLLNGSIAWISNYEETGTFHISILGEVGAKESWTKLFIVGPLPGVEHPIGIGKKGDIFFSRKDNELVWFNLSTQRIEELGVKGDSCCRIMIYKESLLPFNRINN